MLPGVLFYKVLKISKKGDSTPFLRNLFQTLTLLVKTFSPVPIFFFLLLWIIFSFPLSELPLSWTYRENQENCRVPQINSKYWGHKSLVTTYWLLQDPISANVMTKVLTVNWVHNVAFNNAFGTCVTICLPPNKLGTVAVFRIHLPCLYSVKAECLI